jgi:hypothetical protein
MLLITFTLPDTLLTFGEPYPGDGQKQMGIVVALMFVGMQAAVVYLLVSIIAYWIVRKKPMRTRFLVQA